MKKTPLIIAIQACLFSQASQAETTYLDTIQVSNASLESNELTSSYAIETYNEYDIKESGALNLQEFLKFNSSVNVQSGYGNPYSPLLDMRGFGSESGFENIKVIVDGVSLNNIDNMPQLLSSVPLNSIKEIKIIKGAGSVQYGNGATAGAIIINTQNAHQITANELSALYGSHQTFNNQIFLNGKTQYEGFNLSTQLIADAQHSSGTKTINSDGTKNSHDNNNIVGSFNISKGKTSVKLTASKNSSTVNYPGAMSLTDFYTDPSSPQASGNTQQNYTIDGRQLNFNTEVKNTKINYILDKQEKVSEYVTFSYSSKYDSLLHSLNFETHLNKTLVQYGIHLSKNNRESSYGNTTEQNTKAVFIDFTQTLSNHLLLNLGTRYENIEHSYQSTNKNLQKDENLAAYNIGLNYKITPQSTVFANFNHAYLVPNVDRFFDFGGTFNGFIETQKTDTLTTGYKFKNSDTWLQVETFYINLKNEIYYDQYNGKNTNLSKSHKYGASINARNFVTEQVVLGGSYNWTVAKIDDTQYKNNQLPGTPEHSLTLFTEVNYQSSIFKSLPQHKLRISHKATSKVYATSDFKNELGQYRGYNSTNISYQVSNKTTSLQLGINNFFNQENGAFVRRSSSSDTVVYPTDFTQTYYLKANFKF